MSHDRQEPSSEDYFVLDDEEKVEIVNDRGQSLYPKHFESQGSPGGVAISDNDPCKHISNKLSEAPVSCFLDNNNKFVHRGEFDKIVTREVVKLIDPSLLGYGDMTSSKDREWLVREIFGNLPVDGQIQPCIRLLCVLLKIERLDKFKDLWSKEMTDSCLPLTRDGHYNLSCRVHGVSHTAINDLPLQKRKDFVLWARRLTPPFVVWKPSIHRHYILEKGDPLPMVRVKGGEIDDRGEFGEVTKVKIKHDDGKFASHPVSCSQHRARASHHADVTPQTAPQPGQTLCCKEARAATGEQCPETFRLGGARLPPRLPQCRVRRNVEVRRLPPEPNASPSHLRDRQPCWQPPHLLPSLRLRQGQPQAALEDQGCQGKERLLTPDSEAPH